MLLIFTPLARGSVLPWAITIIHMATLLALTLFLIKRILVWKWKQIPTPLNTPFIFLFTLVLLSGLFSLHRLSSIESIFLFADYLVWFYLVVYLTQNRDHLWHICYVIIGVGAFLSLFGFFKQFGINPFTWWDYRDLGDSTGCLSSTYGNRNHLAGYLEMSIPLVFGFLLTRVSLAKRIFIIYLALLMVTALIFSLSRGGWVGFFVSIGLMCCALFVSRRFRAKRLLAGILVGTFAVITIALSTTPVVERFLTIANKEEDASLHERFIVWKAAMRMIKDHPILGAGPGTFKTVFLKYQPPGLTSHFAEAHNDYVHFISETGLLLVPLIIWMGIALYRRGWHKLKNPSRLVRATTLGALTGITAMLVHSIADFNLHIPANALLFTVLCAIVAAPLSERFQEQSTLAV
ncbi:MAG: O-antigen ligase family protein [Pseudomonadota bacterium]